MHGRRDERFDTTHALRLEHGEGVLRNVSASGIYFVTDEALQEGAPVKFTLEFHEFRGGPVRANCIARIVRVEQQEEGQGVAASIISFEFLRIPQPGGPRHPPGG